MPTVLGLDLSKIDLKLVLVAIIIHYVSGFAFEAYSKNETGVLEARVKTLNEERKALEKRSTQGEEFERQIEQLLKQEEKLESRKKIVENIIRTKKNPIQILMYISKNIPEDLWIEKLSVKDNSIQIDGKSLSYKSISKFLDSLDASIYFQKRFDILKQDDEVDPITKVRSEKFSIVGKIARYE